MSVREDNLKEWRGKSPQDLSKMLRDLRLDLMKLRFHKAGKGNVPLHKISVLKRNIARLLTIKSEGKLKGNI